MIFYSLEPFGSEVDFMGHAITASTIANINRKKGTKPYVPADFVPKFEKKKKQSVDEMINIAKQTTA